MGSARIDLLTLPVFLFEGLGFQEEDVGLRRRTGVARHGVHRQDVARYEFVVFQGDQSLALAVFRTPGLRKRDCLLGTGIDGVAQFERGQGIVVAGLHFDYHLFDGADAGIAAGPGDADLGRLFGLWLDEIVLADSDRFTFVQCGNVIDGFALDAKTRGGGPLAGLLQLEFAPVVEHDLAAGEGTVRLDFDDRFGPLNRAQIAARIFHQLGLPEPGGIVVGHPDSAHGRQIDDRQ